MNIIKRCDEVLNMDKSGIAPSFKYREHAVVLAQTCKLLYRAFEIQLMHCEDESLFIKKILNGLDNMGIEE